MSFIFCIESFIVSYIFNIYVCYMSNKIKLLTYLLKTWLYRGYNWALFYHLVRYTWTSVITRSNCRDTARNSSHILLVGRRWDARRSNARCFLCQTGCRSDPVAPAACHHRLPVQRHDAHEKQRMEKFIYRIYGYTALSAQPFIHIKPMETIQYRYHTDSVHDGLYHSLHHWIHAVVKQSL